MEHLKIYDYLMRARQRVFTWVRPLRAGQYTDDVPPWRRSLGGTLTHIMVSEGYYVQRIRGRDVPPYDEWPIRQEEPPPFDALETAWIEQAGQTRAALGNVRDWEADLEYDVTDDDGRPWQLGVAIEDLDFNATMFTRRRVTRAE